MYNFYLFQFFFRQKAPNAELIAEALKAHEKLNDVVRKYFMTDKTFIGWNLLFTPLDNLLILGGSTGSIADLLYLCILKQTAGAGQPWWQNIYLK